MPLSAQTDVAALTALLKPPTIDWEIQSERASSLGRAGRRVESALGALRCFNGRTEDREPLLREAVDAVWSYFVQREMMGLVRHEDAIEAYGIPGEVLRRVGS